MRQTSWRRICDSRLRPRPALVALGFALAALLAASGCGGSSSPAAPSSPSYLIPTADLGDMLSEKVMGSAAASVSIIEYSSLTCPHCATFHVATLPQIKALYIDTGKVKLVYRDFPVRGASTQPVAYAAAGLARCAGTGRYFEALDLLYRGQPTWTASSDPKSAMKQLVAPIGMAADKMDACMASAEIQSEINRVMAEGRASFAVSGTPTFVINGQTIVGSGSFAEFDAILRAALQ